jgi:hypothetical protein
MSINSAYEKREELLILAQQQGYNVSAIQLARWHRAGLLPRPTQQPRTETRGTYSLYPPGTGAQLLVLCSLHPRDAQRDGTHQQSGFKASFLTLLHS